MADQIGNFAKDGILICEVIIPDNEEVYFTGTRFLTHAFILKKPKPLYKISTLKSLLVEKTFHNIKGYLKGAIRFGKINAVKYLFRLCKESYPDFDSIQKWIIRVVSEEVKHLSVIKYFYKVVLKDVIISNTVLQHAAYDNKFEIIRYVIRMGTDVNCLLKDLFFYVAQYGNVKMMKYFIKLGADVHFDNDYAITLAASSENLSAVKFLLKRGCDIHAHEDLAIREAALSGSLKTTKYLVEKGADYRAVQNRAHTDAMEYGFYDIAEYLSSLY